MKVSRAIEILNQTTQETLPITDLDTLDAVMLGIEAMECVRKIRQHPFPEEVLLLPGETPE